MWLLTNFSMVVTRRFSYKSCYWRTAHMMKWVYRAGFVALACVGFAALMYMAVFVNQYAR